jgi:hypothetical protein
MFGESTVFVLVDVINSAMENIRMFIAIPLWDTLSA